MLVRALKVLRFFSKPREPARTSTRQPLISRAMKVGLMAGNRPIGNDEPRRAVLLLPADVINIPVRSRKK
jgi:hypothetical protein